MTASYLICATPRSGSTFLCELLTLTGVAGHPQEWMLPICQPLARQVYGIETSFDDPGYFDRLRERAVTANGVFAAKLMWPTMQQLASGALWNLPPLRGALAEAGPFADFRYIRIVRADRIAQAISWVIAARTDYWQKILSARSAWSSAILEVNGQQDIQRIRTDDLDSRWPIEMVERELGDTGLRSKLFSQIDGFRSVIVAHEAAWSAFFERENAPRLVVRYEDLVAAPAETIDLALRFLGESRPDPLDMTKVALSPLSDMRNEIIAHAYSRESSH